MESVLRLVRRKSAFVYPVPPAPLTAVLVPWFRPAKSRSRVRVFPGGWDAAAEAFQPAAIAGTWAQMEALLGRQIPSLTHALIVLARLEQARLRPGDLLTTPRRQQLWRAFRVPVFEQIVAENGALLAAECEAHAGLHVESSALKLGGWSLGSEPCGCGRKTPWIGLPSQIEEIRAAAHAR